MLQPKMLLSAVVVIGIFVSDAGAFSLSSTPRSARRAATRLSETLADTLFDTISASLPSFGGKQEEDPSLAPLPPPPFQPSPEGVIQRAKLLFACDLGVQDESLLDPNFIWIGPNLGSKVLSKTDYLAAGRFFDLRSVFPDLDYRAHDFRIDENDPMTVRVTARMVGTMRGELRLRNEVIPPNGKQMRCPPEAISMTFDESTGGLTKLCSGWTMDRLVGNTGGLCGVRGAAAVAGNPPSDWEVYPPTQVVKRFFGRPTQQLEEPASFLAPFPETVMIQLAKGIFSAGMAAADPDLLSPSFTYYEPYAGPVNKKTYLEKFASTIFDGLQPDLSYLRVDPYDPYRVWVDVEPSGMTTNGVYVDGPPQAFSFTFDDEGFCTRLTACAVMDPSIGNTGGLTGMEGEKYAAGKASPSIAARPLPEALERVRKRITSPFTKVGVDDYSLVPGAPVPSRPPAFSSAVSPVEKLKVKQPAEKIAPKMPTIPPPPKVTPAAKVKAPETPAKRPTLTIPTFSIPAQSKPDAVDSSAALQKAQAERQAKADAQQKTRAALAEKKLAEKKEAEEAARLARVEALEVQKQKAAQLASEREEAARRREQEAEQARQEREAELEAERQRREQIAANQAVESRRKAQEEEANRIARAAALEAERTRREQLAAEAKNRKAQDQARAIESRRKATEAEAAEKAKAQALEAEARKRAQLAAQQAQVAKQKADEVRRAQEAAAEADRKRLAQLAAEREAERQREAREIEAVKRAKEAAAEAERKRQAQIVAEREAEKERKAKEAEAAIREQQAEIERQRKAKEAEMLNQKREAAAEAERQKKEKIAAQKQAEKERKEQIAAQKQAEKERKEREAEMARQERQRKAQIRAEKLAENLRKQQEAEAAKKARAAALEAERARQAQIKQAQASSPAPSPRATISLFGLGSPKEPAAPKAAPKASPAAAPRSTFSLGALFGGSSDTDDTTASPAAARQTQQPKKSSSPPRGVPVISGWKQNFDGSVTGRISGSSDFEKGEKVTTSPISGKAVGGAVVQTSSGSRYYLEDTVARAPPAKRAVASPPAQAPRPSISLFGLGGPMEDSRPSKSVPKPRPSKPVPKPRPSKPVPKQAAPAQAPRPSISLFGSGGPMEGSRPSKSVPKPRPSKPIPKQVAPAQAPRATISLFGFGGGSSDESSPSKSVPKPRPSAPVPKPRPSKPIPKATTTTQSPRSTISLFGLGSGGDASSSASRSVSVPKSSAKKAAPRGVPTLNGWNKNRDGSVTGRITGSNQFPKNEKVTTSPIASGDFSSGSVVKTTSGSRYFLA